SANFSFPLQYYGPRDARAPLLRGGDGQPSSVCARPIRPSVSAASASPAIRPPPTSEVGLMSDGNAAALPWLRPRCSLQVLYRLENVPPAANQADPDRFRKNPNAYAYGDGNRKASSTKPVA